MKIYVLVANENGEATFNLPTFGRTIRAYQNKKVAQNMAKKFKCHVIEFDLKDGTIVWKYIW